MQPESNRQAESIKMTRIIAVALIKMQANDQRKTGEGRPPILIAPKEDRPLETLI
jgi:hypothetical protein